MVATFPALVGVAFPVRRTGPIFDTIVQDAISGKQTAFAKRATPKWTWELTYDFLRSDLVNAEFQTLAAFYASCFGRTKIFAYTDAVDNAASGQLFGTGDGVTLNFQLVRSLGGFIEPVFMPTGTPTILNAGVAGVAGTDYSIASGGIVSFTVAPPAGAALTWSGSFAWLCRFDNDNIEFVSFMSNLWSASKVSFTSVLL